MTSVFLTAFSFVLVILFGFFLRRAGFFGPRDYQLVSRVVMNLTLPAAVIRNFAALDFTPSLLFLAALGVLFNVAGAAAGWFFSRREDAARRAYAMLSWSGYNTGAFSIPFLQSFLGPAGVGAACIFDIGNAMMCNGAVYAVTPQKEGGRLSPGVMAKRLLSSVVFDVYLLLLALGLLNIPIPGWVSALLAPAAEANPFLAMLMIGLMLELDLRPGYLGRGLATVAARNLLAAGEALLLYRFAPLSLELRQVLVLLIFAPIAVSSLPFSEKCGCDPGLAGFSASVSILVGLGVMTALVLLMGIG